MQIKLRKVKHTKNTKAKKEESFPALFSKCVIRISLQTLKHKNKN